MTIHAVPKIARALVVLVAALAFAASGGAAELVEGKTYRRIANPQPTETGKKIEVIEFFSYGCPHCAELEPHLDAWLAKAPQDVAFRRVPVMFQQRWVPLAKIYYTLDALGVESKLSPEVFKAIHGSNTALWDTARFYDWAASKGLDRKKVEEAILDVEKAIKGDDKEAIEAAVNRLGQAGQAIHQQAAAQAQSADQGAAPGAGATGDVVDAEFEEVDDDKKS